jgi:hypothetical protein
MLFKIYIFINLQSCGIRVPINEMITLVEYAMDEKATRGAAHQAKLVLCITSYHYTQITQEQPDPLMSRSDLIIQLKMMSTAFATAKSHNVNIGCDVKMAFDRNGIALPFDFFMELLSSGKFQEFMQRSADNYRQEIATRESEQLQDMIYKEMMMENANANASADKPRFGTKRQATCSLEQINESLSTQQYE